jgi:hypothetical protein
VLATPGSSDLSDGKHDDDIHLLGLSLLSDGVFECDRVLVSFGDQSEVTIQFPEWNFVNGRCFGIINFGFYAVAE